LLTQAAIGQHLNYSLKTPICGQIFSGRCPRGLQRLAKKPGSTTGNGGLKVLIGKRNGAKSIFAMRLEKGTKNRWTIVSAPLFMVLVVMTFCLGYILCTGGSLAGMSKEVIELCLGWAFFVFYWRTRS